MTRDAAATHLFDAQLVQAAATFEQHQEAIEQPETLEQHVVAMRPLLAPGGAAGVTLRGRHEAKVRCAVVRAHPEAVPQVVDAVLVPLAARLEDGEVAVGVVGAQDAHFGTQRVARDRHQVLAGLAAPQEDAERLVRLFVDQVVGGIGPQPVPEHLVGAQRVGILADVEQGRTVCGPGQVRRDVRDLVRQRLPGRQILEADGVEAPPHIVDGIGQDAVVRADRRPNGGVLLALGDLVHVDKDLLGRRIGGAAEGVAVRRPAAVDGVLLPLLVAGVVPVVAVAIGNRRIVLHDAAADLLEQGLLQLLGMRHDAVEIGVFGLQVGDDFRIFPLPKPVVLVDAYVAVGLEFVRSSGGHRRVARAGGRGRAGGHGEDGCEEADGSDCGGSGRVCLCGEHGHGSVAGWCGGTVPGALNFVPTAGWPRRDLRARRRRT